MRFLLLLILSAFFCADNFAQTSVIILYRKSEKKFDKYTVRSSIGVTKADTIPPANGICFSTHDMSQISISARIENYASWPDAYLRLNMVENDTTFVELTFKKDGLGNPEVKLNVVPSVTAKEMVSTEISIRLLSDIDYSIPNKSKRFPKRSGTGFLVSSRGYIVTNYHVVEKSSDIRIRNVKGAKSSDFKAAVVFKDEKSDLAILKLEDSVSRFDTIPYTIKQSVVDIGEKIELFGYPLTNSMGDDVKLTNGIISSINGYQGDTIAYQLSAPVQPGNSGGPVFDEKGNLVAVVNAKHILAENATYAIKSTHLLSALQQVPGFTFEKSSAELWRLTLVEQAKILQKLVYIIDVY